jgi:hypothetical protein
MSETDEMITMMPAGYSAPSVKNGPAKRAMSPMQTNPQSP